MQWPRLSDCARRPRSAVCVPSLAIYRTAMTRGRNLAVHLRQQAFLMAEKTEAYCQLPKVPPCMRRCVFVDWNLPIEDRDWTR